jgi:hypothetical protein
MKIWLIRISLMLSITLSIAHANGGGYFRGGAENTGNIKGFEPKATGNIQILDEKLHIKAGKKQAAVEVRYLMKNMTDKKVKVRFGFPIEESFGNANAYNPSEEIKHTTPAYCKNYQITAGGEKVKVKWEAEKNEEKDKQLKGLSGWNVSELSFAAGEEIPVMIRFDSDYSEENWSVSEDSSTSAAIFRYRLSTAACWHGAIVQGRIVIEADGIDPKDIRIIKPVNRFKKEGDRWIWNFENLEPSLADDFEVECQPAIRVLGHKSIGKDSVENPPHLYVDYIQRGDRWSMLHSNYNVKASSTLKSEGEHHYHAENVRYSWDDTAWSEGAAGSGVGEWLEITPLVSKPLINIHLKPGFQKDATDLFKANARPKKIRIELNGEHKFDAEIPDKEEVIIIPIAGYTKPIQKMRFTFTEVYPGNKFEDMCITSIRLHAKLDREPKVQPAR